MLSAGRDRESCGKHFPGYSAATVDAHHDLPLIERTIAELNANELAVFHAFAGRVDSMMICHGWYPCFEPQKTAASSLAASSPISSATSWV